jgi:enoyl-CoA hydratase/carnithine racemase
MSGLRTSRADEVLVLTLDRPAAANALDDATHDALVTALAAGAADPAVRAAMLTGAGKRVFSAGADLKEHAALDPRSAGDRRRAMLVRTLLAVLDFPKPLVAAIQGKAIGGGCMLALLADEVIACEGAVLRMPEIALDMPSPVGFAILTSRCGMPEARRLVQTGEALDAAGALALGLIDMVVDDGALESAALARAKSLAAQPTYAYGANKTWINRAPRHALEAAAAEAERLHAARYPRPEGLHAD